MMKMLINWEVVVYQGGGGENIEITISVVCLLLHCFMQRMFLLLGMIAFLHTKFVCVCQTLLVWLNLLPANQVACVI